METDRIARASLPAPTAGAGRSPEQTSAPDDHDLTAPLCATLHTRDLRKLDHTSREADSRVVTPTLRRLTLIAVGLTPLLGGGTCSEPPPWHDVSGTWVNASFGPDQVLGSDPTTARDLDLVVVLEAALPLDRVPLPVTGRVCVIDRAGLGAQGSYGIDPAASTWAGADYGGARLDLVASAPDGRRLTLSQAHMANASPDALDNAVITWKPVAGPTSTFSFEGLRRSADASCPAIP